MKNYILLSILAITISTISYGQKTVKTYDPAYAINTKTLERIAQEAEVTTQTGDVAVFLMNFPILDDLSKFSKRETYSMINSALIVSTEDTEKFVIFHLVQDKTYKVRKANRTYKDVTRPSFR